MKQKARKKAAKKTGAKKKVRRLVVGEKRVGRPVKKRDYKPVTIWAQVPPDLAAHFEADADENLRTKSAHLRYIIDFYFDYQRKQAKAPKTNPGGPV